MFTGIIEEVGHITNIVDTGGDLRVSIKASKVLADVAIGDSIAVSGCCLTVVAFDDSHFETELSKETVAKTADRWRSGQDVNLERAMRISDRLGGHIVSGHVEAVGEVLEVRQAPGAYIITVKAAAVLAKYLIPKGSITVDGVSLTLVDVGGPAGSQPDWEPELFSLWIIPHTLEVTTLGQLDAGDRVNLEADVIAKYVERLTLLKGNP
jgi:riboflavin synthase